MTMIPFFLFFLPFSVHLPKLVQTWTELCLWVCPLFSVSLLFLLLSNRSQLQSKVGRTNEHLSQEQGWEQKRAHEMWMLPLVAFDM